MLDQYPELEKNITISNIDAGVLIKSNNPRVTLAFTSNHISTDIEYPSEKSNDIKNYTEFSDNALNIITETLEISSFTRVGNRLIYHYRTDTLDEVNDIFTHYKFFQTSDSITNTFGESLTEPEIKFIASYDKDIQQTIRIGTVSRSYDKLSLPKSIDAKLIVDKGMSFDIDYTRTAANLMRGYRKYEQKIILDAVDRQLQYEPTSESKKRKRLGKNPLSTWELRVGKYRVFYDVIPDGEYGVVKIKAVGHKVHNWLHIAGKEFEL